MCPPGTTECRETLGKSTLVDLRHDSGHDMKYRTQQISADQFVGHWRVKHDLCGRQLVVFNSSEPGQARRGVFLKTLQQSLSAYPAATGEPRRCCQRI